MTKRILALLLLLQVALYIVACTGNSRKEQDSQKTDVTTVSNDSTVTDTRESTEENTQTVTGFDLKTYPDPYRVREYENLTEDQKVAYDALSAALLDVTQNGIDPTKTYPLEKRISAFDYLLAFDIISANFKAAEKLTSFSSEDSMGTTQYCDSIVVLSESNADEYFEKYKELTAEADRILQSIEHDGSDYGKAFAIAKWIADNVVYAHDYLEDNGRELNSAYTALVKREAICDGMSKAYDLLCKKAGLETIYVSGDTVFGDHAWNMICISDNWYYVDVTWMSSPDNYYSNFMMSEKISYFNGHRNHCYYWDRENNINVVPEAVSYDYYFRYFESLEELQTHFKTLETISDTFSYSVFIPIEIDEEIMNLNGTEVYSEARKKTYYYNFGDRGFIDEKAGVVQRYLTLSEKIDSIATTNEKSDIKGMVKAWWRPSYAIHNFDYAEKSPLEGFKINICLPEHFVNSSSYENTNVYLRFVEKDCCYARCFEFIDIYEVDDDFILDETVHSRTNVSGTSIPTENFEVITCADENGIVSLKYEKKTDNSFVAIVYIRLSNKYIVEFTYSDVMKNYDYLEKIINSVDFVH